MLVVKGKTMKCLDAYNVKAAPEDTCWAYQSNAYMEDTLGTEWFQEVFLNNCGRERPQLLILDSHSSHEVLELLKCAKENKIIVLALPPHTTHVLQPLDRSVFKPLSAAYSAACSEFMSESPNNIITKWNWPQMFKLAWNKAVSVTNIRSGFKACGIFPCDVSVIPREVFLPCEPFDRPAPVTTSTRPDVPATQSKAREISATVSSPSAANSNGTNSARQISEVVTAEQPVVEVSEPMDVSLSSLSTKSACDALLELSLPVVDKMPENAVEVSADDLLQLMRFTGDPSYG
jgi:hypothetical protein